MQCYVKSGNCFERGGMFFVTAIKEYFRVEQPIASFDQIVLAILFYSFRSAVME